MVKVSWAGILLVSLLASAARAEDGWLEAKSAHFTLLTDAGKGRARDLLYELEQLRRLITESLPAQPVESHVPAVIYAFKNEKSLRPFQPLRDGSPEDWAAMFRPMGFKNFIALRADGSKDAVRELVFEQYLNLLLSYTSIDYPVWLQNGFSLFYGNARITKDHGEIGKMHERHRRELGEYRSMPLQDLFAVERDSPWYRDGGRRALFDAQSWALLHYLLIGRDADGRKALGDFLSLLAGGKDEVLAFQEALGMPLPEIEAEVGSYIRKRVSLYLKVSLSPLDLEKDFLVSELSPSIADARLGELLLAVGRTEEALSRLDASLHAHPDAPDAYEALGFLHARSGDSEKSRAFLEQAVVKGSTNPMVHLQYGRSLIEEYNGKENEMPEAVRSSALASLRKALDAAPGHADAARLYGFLRLLGEPDEVDEGLAVVMKALEANRGHTLLLFILAQLHARQDDFDVARTIYENLLQRALAPEMVAMIRRQLDYANARAGARR